MAKKRKRKVIIKRVRSINYFKHDYFYKEYLRNKKVIIVGPSDLLIDSKLGEKIDNYDIIVRLNNHYPINPINMNYEKIHEDIGNRTDILYHTGAIMRTLKWAANDFKTGRIKLLRRDGVKWIVAKRDPVYGTIKEKRALNRFAVLNKKYVETQQENGITLTTVFNTFIKDLRSKINYTEPNMSTIAIMHILEAKIKQLEIVGCDFYSGNGGYHPSYYIPKYLGWDDSSKELIRIDGQKRNRGSIGHDYQEQIKFLLNIIDNDKRIIIDDKTIELWKEKL